MLNNEEITVVLIQEIVFELGNMPETLLQVDILKEISVPFAPTQDTCFAFTVLRDEGQFPMLPNIDKAMRTVIVDRILYEPEEQLFTAYCSWMYQSGMIARTETGISMPIGTLPSEHSLDEVRFYLEAHGWEIADIEHIRQKTGNSSSWDIIYGN